MDNFVETYRGVIYPWQCDHLGHMNVMHYSGMFDQGGHHLLAAAGFDWHSLTSNNVGFVDVKHEIEFKVEQRSGSLIVITGGVLKIGKSSVTLVQRMKNAETGDEAAVLKNIVVYFDMKTRKSDAIPEDLRHGFEKLIVQE